MSCAINKSSSLYMYCPLTYIVTVLFVLHTALKTSSTLAEDVGMAIVLNTLHLATKKLGQHGTLHLVPPAPTIRSKYVNKYDINKIFFLIPQLFISLESRYIRLYLYYCSKCGIGLDLGTNGLHTRSYVTPG